MKLSWKIFPLALVGALCFGQGNPNAANILFAHVDDDGPYVGNGNALRDMLVTAGHTVTTRFLDAAVYADYGTFDQIFVYDLYTGADNEANQLANYAGIAAWYNGLSDKNLILDGRIISSTPPWTPTPETTWIQNYAAQLDLRGGGLVLGTDHAPDYTDGINQINLAIGIDPFSGFYFTAPLEAYVDPLSPLFVSGLVTCTADPTAKCIDDSSSTSFVATGPQPNGQFLTPVAYHGGTTTEAYDLAAVSSTIGSLTFGTCGGPGEEPCPTPEPGYLAGLSLMGLGLGAIGLARRRRMI